MKTVQIIEERLKQFEHWSLKGGAHSPDSTFCVMEAVAYVAGEKWSDNPKCACPIISAFLRSWNDALPNDADRDRLLKPLIPQLVNTRSTKRVELKRGLMATDWLVRVHTPAWLRIAGLVKQAESLEQLPEITAMTQLPSIRGPIEAIRQDAAAARDAARAAATAAARAAATEWAAATAAATEAARAAARAAATEAARDAATEAAWAAATAAARAAATAAARAAARAAATEWAAATAAATEWAAATAAATEAARDAATEAAWDAATAAARAKLEPTIKELQQSALVLVERMIVAKIKKRPVVSGPRKGTSKR